MAKAKKGLAGFGFVVLHFGYAESGLVSAMVLRSEVGPFATKATAVKSVARFFFDKWLAERDSRIDRTKIKKCCAKAKAEDALAVFCKTCGSPLEEEPFFVENYQAWLLRQPSLTANDWDDHQGEWWPWCCVAEVVSSRKVSGVEIRERAEEVLTYSIDTLADSTPEYARAPLSEYAASKLDDDPDNRVAGKGRAVDGLIDAAVRSFDELAWSDE